MLESRFGNLFPKTAAQQSIQREMAGSHEATIKTAGTLCAQMAQLIRLASEALKGRSAPVQAPQTLPKAPESGACSPSNILIHGYAPPRDDTEKEAPENREPSPEHKLSGSPGPTSGPASRDKPLREQLLASSVSPVKSNHREITGELSKMRRIAAPGPHWLGTEPNPASQVPMSDFGV